jgi:hypothetical protein
MGDRNGRMRAKGCGLLMTPPGRSRPRAARRGVACAPGRGGAPIVSRRPD